LHHDSSEMLVQLLLNNDRRGRSGRIGFVRPLYPLMATPRDAHYACDKERTEAAPANCALFASIWPFSRVVFRLWR
jgi:hypothetical protein